MKFWPWPLSNGIWAEAPQQQNVGFGSSVKKFGPWLLNNRIQASTPKQQNVGLNPLAMKLGQGPFRIATIFKDPHDYWSKPNKSSNMNQQSIHESLKVYMR